MTENLPNPARPLSPSTARADAAATLGTATGTPPFACSLLVEALDYASWGVLAAAGASPLEALAVLRLLWADDAPASGEVTQW